jgi:Protein of unknown function (DUF433)
MASVIVKNPAVLSGEPVFRGTRVPFKALTDYLEGGESLGEFLEFTLSTRVSFGPNSYGGTGDRFYKDLLKVLHQPNIVVPGCGHNRKVTSIGRWQAIHF